MNAAKHRPADRTAPAAPVDPCLVARRHIDFARVDSALCSRTA